MRTGAGQLRFLIATVLCLSLVVNFFMLTRTRDGVLVDVAVRHDDDKVRWEAKQTVLKILEGSDLSSKDSAKALLFDSLVTCLLDNFNVDTSRLSSGNNYSLLEPMEKNTLKKLTLKLESDVAKKNAIITFLTQPAINDFTFSYSINPKNSCSPEIPEVLMVVPSAPENFENRLKVRNSERGRYAAKEGSRTRLLFFVGKPSENATLLHRVVGEAEKYRDVVLVDFVDVYRNILLKALSMLHWATTYCRGVTYVIRTDDDVKVTVPRLLKALKRKSQQFENFILGEKKIGWDVVRRNSSKYYVSVEEYPHATLPPFALGGLLGYPISTVALLYQAALRLQPFWLDDVFITGMCAPSVGVPLLDDPDFKFKHHEW